MSKLKAPSLTYIGIPHIDHKLHVKYRHPTGNAIYEAAAFVKGFGETKDSHFCFADLHSDLGILSQLFLQGI